MAVLSSNDEIATRFGPYLEELHELFALHRVPFGTPAELPGFVERLDGGGSFAEDVSSILRSMILREGGSLPQTQLLEVFAVAVAGPTFDPTKVEAQPFFRRLLSFVGTLVRRPWNVPPGHAEPDPALFTSAPEMPEPAGERIRTMDGAHQAKVPAPVPPPVDRLSSHEAQRPDPVPEAATPAPPQSGVAGRPLWVAGVGAALALLLLIGFDRRHSSPNASQTVATPAHTAAGRQTNAPAPHTETAAAQPNLPQPAPAGIANPAPAVRPRSGPVIPILPRTPHDVQLATHPSTSSPAPAFASGGSVAEASAGTPRPITPAAPAPISRPIPTPANVPVSTSAAEMRRPVIALPRGRTSHGMYFEVSSGVMASHLVHATDPGYPVLARLTHIQGQVILQAVISREGEVVSTKILSGHHLLRGAAAAAVKQWRYRPFLVDGRPANVATIVTVEFHDHP